MNAIFLDYYANRFYNRVHLLLTQACNKPAILKLTLLSRFPAGFPDFFQSRYIHFIQLFMCIDYIAIKKINIDPFKLRRMLYL
jgi:hypothetical protein